jgi:hypothetical protein
MVTENEVKIWCNMNHGIIEEERRECPERVPEFIMPVFEAGVWFGQALEKAGATEKEREDACFAMGQRACMGGPARAYTIAAECYNAWMEGRKDTPGAELAHELVDEVLQP